MNKKEIELELSDENLAILQRKKEGERVDRVRKSFEELLQKENCIAEVSMIITPNGNFPQLNIIAKK